MIAFQSSTASARAAPGAHTSAVASAIPTRLCICMSVPSIDGSEGARGAPSYVEAGTAGGNCHVSRRTFSLRQHSHPNVPRAGDAYPTSTRWFVKKSGVKTGGKPWE